jgi:DNA repair exonuclease SbcCD ATPase subunit
MASPDARQTQSRSARFSASQSFRASTPNNSSSLTVDHRLKVMEIRMNGLQEENQILKDKNRKLKEISAALLGKQINHKDARLGLLSADIEERDKDLEEFKKKEKELLRLKEDEIQQLRHELDYLQINRLKQEEQFQKQRLEIEEEFNAQISQVEKRMKEELRKVNMQFTKILNDVRNAKKDLSARRSLRSGKKDLRQPIASSASSRTNLAARWKN